MDASADGALLRFNVMDFGECNRTRNKMNGLTMRVSGAKYKPKHKVTGFSKLSFGKPEAKTFSASAIRTTQLLDTALSLSIF